MAVSDTLFILKLCASGVVGITFALFAWQIIHNIYSSAGTYSENASEETSRQFEDLFLFIPAKRIAEIGRTAAIAFFLIFFIPLFSLTNPVSTIAGTILGLFFGACALMTPGKIVAFLKVRRRNAFNLQLVEALSTMSNALRAGFSINQAFESVVQSGQKPISQEFDVMLQQMRVGMNFYDALQSLDKRVGSEDLTLVVTAIDIARRTGGNLTEIFDKIGRTIRERMRIERRVQTLTAQGRLQGIIVALMPAVLGIMMTVIKPDMMLPFFKSVHGMAAIGITLILITVGWLCIRKIIKIDV